MKKYKVQLTPRARASITRIVSYLEEEQSTTIAQHVRRGIIDKVKSLKYLPKSHEQFKEISTEDIIFYKVLQWKYKIIYTVNDDVLEVVVVQVYHGARGSEWVQGEFSV